MPHRDGFGIDARADDEWSIVHSDVGGAGKSDPRLRHGHSGHARHLDDAIGVRDRGADEGQSACSCDSDHDRDHSAAATSLAAGVTRWGLQCRRRRQRREHRGRSVGSLQGERHGLRDRRLGDPEHVEHLERGRAPRGIGRRAARRRARTPRAALPGPGIRAEEPPRGRGATRRPACRLPRTAFARSGARTGRSRARTGRWRCRCRHRVPARATSTPASRAASPASSRSSRSGRSGPNRSPTRRRAPWHSRSAHCRE